MGNSTSGSLLPAEYILPSEKHTATVIFLHGLGDTGNGWRDQFQTQALPYVKYIFPHAPSIPVTLTGGAVKPAWFDVLSLSHDAEDGAGVKRASNQLKAFVENEEAQGIGRNRIVIGGFSQGGAVALYTTVVDQKPVAGVLAFSTWLPLHKVLMTSPARTASLPPILQCHGTADTTLPFKIGQLTARLLQQLSPSHELRPLQGVAHSSCDEEMRAARSFIMERLP